MSSYFFSNVILVRVVRNRVLMFNAMFSKKIFECLIDRLSFSNAILLRGIENIVLMLNAMFSKKIFESLIDIFAPNLSTYFLNRKRELLLNKSLN
jgi:hypothetical protein